MVKINYKNVIFYLRDQSAIEEGDGRERTRIVWSLTADPPPLTLSMFFFYQIFVRAFCIGPMGQ